MVLILDEKQRVLLQKRAGTGAWHVPGGYMELGETLEDTARREAKEETGLELNTLELAGVFSGPEFHWYYPNGDEVYNVTLAYVSRGFTGSPTADGEEGTEVRFFSLNDLPETLGPPARPVLNDLFQRNMLG